ncbi:hypothetical protein RhoFasK5_03744|nr:hypothetical protein [Rhodococcus kroppenstedtii]
MAHEVRGGADGDAAILGGAGFAADHGGGVEFGGQPCSRGDDGTVAVAGEGGGVGAEAVVDEPSVLGGEAGGFADQQGGPPFGEFSAAQLSQGVGHLGGEGAGEAEVGGAALG